MTTTSQSPSSTCPNSYPSAPSPFDLQCASCAGSACIQAPRAHPRFACVKRHSSAGSSNPPCRIICSTILINKACMRSTYGDNANNPCSSCTHQQTSPPLYRAYTGLYSRTDPTERFLQIQTLTSLYTYTNSVILCGSSVHLSIYDTVQLFT